MKKTVNVLNLIALIVLFAGCTLRPVDNTTLGVEIPGETLENLLTPFMYYSPDDNGTYAPYFKLTWEYQGNRGEEIIPVSKIGGCEKFLIGETNSISSSQKIFTINDIPVGSSLTANLELFDAYGFALYSSKTVTKKITAKDKSLTLELYSTSPVVYYDFSITTFYGVADDKEQTFTLSQEQSGLTCSFLQPRSFPYIREKPEEGNQPRAHHGTMITGITGGGETTRAVIPPEISYTSSDNGDSIPLDASNQTPQWVAGGTDFSKNKIWAVHEKTNENEDTKTRILCYGGKYYTIEAEQEAYYNDSINWAVDGGNLYAVVLSDVAYFFFLRGAIPENGTTTVTLSDTGFKFAEPRVPGSWGDITGANGITDATARDGALYFLYCQRNDIQTETRGFLYKIPDAANMSNNSDAKVLSGWTDEEDHIPGGSGPMGNKLYNPLRFVAVKPEKLYIADGGFSKPLGTENSSGNNPDMNRIMVFDLFNTSVSVHKDLENAHQLIGSSGYFAY